MKKGRMGPKNNQTMCDICGKHYKSIMPNWQGDGCASLISFEGKIIQCCYGSEYDGNVYSILDKNESLCLNEYSPLPSSP